MPLRPPPSGIRRLALQVRRVLGLPGRDRRLAAEALVELARARLALAVFSFRRVAAGLGETVPSASPAEPPPGPLTAEQHETVRRLAWILPRVARGAAFTANCLPQAIAGRRMLQRRNISSVLHIGVAKSDPGSGLEAHAWLQAAALDVTGGSPAGEFTEISRIV